MPENIIGAQLRRLRYQTGLTQSELAAKCCLAGFDMSRGTLAKIEAQVRCVSDKELLMLANALGVAVDKLFQSRIEK